MAHKSGRISWISWIIGYVFASFPVRCQRMSWCRCQGWSKPSSLSRLCSWKHVISLFITCSPCSPHGGPLHMCPDSSQTDGDCSLCPRTTRFCRCMRENAKYNHGADNKVYLPSVFDQSHFEAKVRMILIIH